MNGYGYYRVVLYLFILITYSKTSFAYTLVLKSTGKEISGTLVYEDEKIVKIKDSQGVEINFKKEKLDLDKMKNLEERDREVQERLNKEEQVRLTKQLKEQKQAAEKEKFEKDTIRKILEASKRSGKNSTFKPGHTFTRGDLASVPDNLSVFSGPSTPEAVDTKPDTALAEKSTDQSAENKWKSEALALITKVSKTNSDYERYKSECESGPDYGKSWVTNQKLIFTGRLNPDGTPEVAPELGLPTAPTQQQIADIARREAACQKADMAHEDLITVAREYQAFLDRAKREGIPSGWVEADRIFP